MHDNPGCGSDVDEFFRGSFVWQAFCCLLCLNEGCALDQTARLLGIYLLPREGIALVAGARADRILGKFVNRSNARL